MLGGIYLRAAAGETGNEDEFGKELCKEITKSEQDHIHACLQAASGVLNDNNTEALTVYKLVMAGRNDPEYTSLKHLLENNLPWGGECKSYGGQNRKLLSTSQGIVMWKNRVVIPVPLRAEALKHLHVGHQGTSSRLKRSEELIWWPNLKEDLENLRKACPECKTHQPSLPKERPKGMINPRHPFQSLHADYFHLAGKIFLVTVDPYTSWPIVFRCSKGGTALELTGFLREVFSSYRVPRVLVSDGGPQFTAMETNEFLKKWRVEQRISSAYNPHANLRAETAVKSIKRILREAMGEGGRLNDDKAARAILEYRNTPIRETERSPSMMLYARRMRDMFQIKDTIDETRYDIHKDFILASEDRERAYLEKAIREGKRWAEHTTNQKPLTPGQPVLLQSMKGNDKGQWTSSGTVWTANPEISQYNIKMDGSGRLALRNRTNLRPIEIQDAAQNKELELGGNAPPSTEVTPTTETKGPHEELNGKTLSQPNNEVSPEMKPKAGERELTQDSRHSTLNQKD